MPPVVAAVKAGELRQQKYNMVKKANKKMKKTIKVAKKKSEITELGRVLRTLGGIGGGFAGGMIGQGAAGSAVGTGLGAAVSRWLGQGDYSVTSNSVLRAATTVPSMHKNDQTVVVRHKEFVGELRGNQNFTVAYRYSLNPGIALTFPWLHSIAAQYSEYRIRGMVFHYVPTSGASVASSNTALGSVMFQTSYRASENPPGSKIEMMNEYWASEGRPCDEFCHPIECDPKENPFNVQYVRTGGLPAGENLLMYDLGTTTVAVTGMQTTGTVLGDIWCTYEVELKKPKLTGLNTEATRSLYSNSSTGITNANPLGSGPVLSTIDGVSAVGSQITFPGNLDGKYVVVLTISGFTAAGGVTVMTSGPATLTSLAQAQGSASLSYVAILEFTGSVNTTLLTISLTTLTGATLSTLRITEWNADFA
ncbi:hypothetical protein 2 [Changjiang tombus-like virus 9]|uniref:hypothetical protein 2 n=1 Tax=Changjiang tombus-like virus 9 TaxID=1922823 RepID=UPI00090A7ED5|nr:hypothetical protein 2 [Changjiang tombus-like virus 9]APG76267.1 hypothetical protein 2 [Changjiang tombus-like virus 9]